MKGFTFWLCIETYSRCVVFYAHFFELPSLLLTWDCLDSVTGREGRMKLAPEEEVRALMGAREGLTITGEYPAYADQGILTTQSQA